MDEKVAAAELAESQIVPLYEACQNKLALVYSAVLQWNMAARFEKATHFDEAAFYELLYKFMTHTIRKWRIGDVLLCPSALWKEVDVELGRVFRGKDFNLEMRGLVRDPSQMGRWKPKRKNDRPARGHEHRTPGFSEVVLQRSP